MNIEVSIEVGSALCGSEVLGEDYVVPVICMQSRFRNMLDVNNIYRDPDCQLIIADTLSLFLSCK